jgi:hypothetical protein
MPLTILELLLKIVLLAMEGQTPAQREKMWEWYIADLSFWRALLKLDPSPAPVQSVTRVVRAVPRRYKP